MCFRTFLILYSFGSLPRLAKRCGWAPGVDASTKLLGLADGFTLAFQTSMPGAAVDWLVGLIGAAAGPPGGLCEREKCQKVPEGCGIRERPLGHKGGYCPFYGPQAGKQHHPDPDGRLMMFRQAQKSGFCPEIKMSLSLEEAAVVD